MFQRMALVEITPNTIYSGERRQAGHVITLYEFFVSGMESPTPIQLISAPACQMNHLLGLHI